MLASTSLEANKIPIYTEGVIQALRVRDFDHAAALTRKYVVQVLPDIVRAYREASLDDA